MRHFESMYFGKLIKIPAQIYWGPEDIPSPSPRNAHFGNSLKGKRFFYDCLR